MRKAELPHHHLPSLASPFSALVSFHSWWTGREESLVFNCEVHPFKFYPFVCNFDACISLLMNPSLLIFLLAGTLACPPLTRLMENRRWPSLDWSRDWQGLTFKIRPGYTLHSSFFKVWLLPWAAHYAGVLPSACLV